MLIQIELYIYRANLYPGYAITIPYPSPFQCARRKRSRLPSACGLRSQAVFFLCTCGSIPAYDPVAIRFFWFSNLHLILRRMFGFLGFSSFLSCLSTQIRSGRDAWWYKIDSYTWFAGSFAFAKHFLRTEVHFPKKIITCVLVLYTTNYFIPIEQCCYNISSKVIRILQID